MKVNFHSVVTWERGYRIVMVSAENPDRAVVITLENGIDEESVLARIKNAFATLEHGIKQENAA